VTETSSGDDALAGFRRRHPEADRWATGCGVIRHTDETQARIFSMAAALGAGRPAPEGFFARLEAADAGGPRRSASWGSAGPLRPPACSS